MDALSRIAKFKYQDKTISASAVVVFSLIYAALLVGITLLDLGYNQLGAAIAVEISYSGGSVVLATILFKIDTQSVSLDESWTSINTQSVKHGEENPDLIEQNSD